MLLYDEQQKNNITISYQQRPCPYHRKLAELIASLASPTQCDVLDMGCGAGNTLVMLDRLRPGMNYTIADVDPHCLGLTAEKVVVKSAYQLGDGGGLESIEGRFDFILLSHVLQYDESPAATVRKLLALLKPGGRLIAATPNPAAPPILVNNLMRRDYAKGNAYFWDRSVFKNFLTNVVGAEVHTMTEDYVPLPVVTRFEAVRPVERGLAKLLPWFSFSIIAVVGQRRAA